MHKPINSHRNKKNTLLSGALHGIVLATLWFTASDISTPEPTPPEVVDATILPATAEVTPEKEQTTQPPATPQATPKTLEKAKTEAVKSNQSSHTESTHAQQISPSKTPAKKTPETTADNGTQAPKDNGKGDGKSNTANNTPLANATSEANTTASKPLVNGVPIAVSPIGGFQITYDVVANKGSIELGGSATLTFKRSDGTYTADLTSKAAIGRFEAHAQGEIRDNTVATTRFKDWRSISFFGMGNETVGSNFFISYPEKAINFGSSNSDTSPLPYTVVYDYLSAIVYLQALLQQHPDQGRAGNRIQLPIGKRTTVEMATVTFKASERLSTAEGAFDGAVPASIQIPSGSIQRIDVWFVPEKKYRPLKIDLGFTRGKATLISRQSN